MRACAGKTRQARVNRHSASFANFTNFRFANSIFANFASLQIHSLMLAARAALDKFTAAALRLRSRYRAVSIFRDLKFSHAAYLATSSPISRDDLHYLRHIGLVSRQIHDAAMRPNLIVCFTIHTRGFTSFIRLPRTRNRNDPLPH